MTSNSSNLRFVALPTADARSLQAGHADANGMTPERQVSDGGGNPCRHCLTDIAEGEDMLVLAYRPFPNPQPYAEVGPIFLHAEPCERHPDSSAVPAMFKSREAMLIRGYGADDRIMYGSGNVVETTQLEDHCRALLAEQDTDYVHLRSATNNCYQARVERD